MNATEQIALELIKLIQSNVQKSCNDSKHCPTGSAEEQAKFLSALFVNTVNAIEKGLEEIKE